MAWPVLVVPLRHHKQCQALLSGASVHVARLTHVEAVLECLDHELAVGALAPQSLHLRHVPILDALGERLEAREVQNLGHEKRGGKGRKAQGPAAGCAVCLWPCMTCGHA